MHNCNSSAVKTRCVRRFFAPDSCRLQVEPPSSYRSIQHNRNHVSTNAGWGVMVEDNPSLPVVGGLLRAEYTVGKVSSLGCPQMKELIPIVQIDTGELEPLRDGEPNQLAGFVYGNFAVVCVAEVSCDAQVLGVTCEGLRSSSGRTVLRQRVDDQGPNPNWCRPFITSPVPRLPPW